MEATIINCAGELFIMSAFLAGAIAIFSDFQNR